MLDEMAVPLFRVVGKIMLYVFVELFFHIFFYLIGRTFLVVVSLGQYRRWLGRKGDSGHKSDGYLEAFVGLLLIVGLIIYLVV